MQGEQQETGELRRLHLRLERANEHVNQLQSRLVSQASSAGTSCSDQLAAAHRAQQAQQLEIESLRRQLAGSQASTSSSSSKEEEEEFETQRAKQQAEIKSLRQQLQDHKDTGAFDRDQQLGHLKAEITQLQRALAKATAEATGLSTQTGAQTDNQAGVSHSSTAADGGKQDASTQLSVLSNQDWSPDSEAAQWCQLALQDRPAFCDQLSRLQQELQQQRADLAERKVSAAEQADRLAQAAADLADKASALQRCFEEVAALQSQLTDCKSVTSLQSDQLAVLQAEVDQLRCSLAAAEKLAGGSTADEQLKQEVEDLRSRLQVSLPFTAVCVMYVHSGYIELALYVCSVTRFVFVLVACSKLMY